MDDELRAFIEKAEREFKGARRALPARGDDPELEAFVAGTLADLGMAEYPAPQAEPARDEPLQSAPAQNFPDWSIWKALKGGMMDLDVKDAAKLAMERERRGDAERIRRERIDAEAGTKEEPGILERLGILAANSPEQEMKLREDAERERQVALAARQGESRRKEKEAIEAAERWNPGPYAAPESGFGKVAHDVARSLPYSGRSMAINAASWIPALIAPETGVLSLLAKAVPLAASAYTASGEASDEMADVYNHYLRQGLSPAEAYKKAYPDYITNMAILTVSNALEGAVTAGTGKAVKEGAEAVAKGVAAKSALGRGAAALMRNDTLKKALTSKYGAEAGAIIYDTLSEGGEEGAQNIAASLTKGEPVDWGQTGYEALVGGVSGGLIGGAGAGAARLSGAARRGVSSVMEKRAEERSGRAGGIMDRVIAEINEAQERAGIEEAQAQAQNAVEPAEQGMPQAERPQPTGAEISRANAGVAADAVGMPPALSRAEEEQKAAKAAEEPARPYEAAPDAAGAEITANPAGEIHGEMVFKSGGEVTPDAETRRAEASRAEAPQTEAGGPSVKFRLNGRWTSTPAEYDVVEADDLVTSNLDSGGVNPAYPARLQPRDRSRTSGLLQVGTMARDLNPELLGADEYADRGAPIIDADGNVISGNGRAMALRLAYNSLGDTSGARYREWLRNYAASLGIDPSRVEGMSRPVLVRRVTDPNLDLQALAEDANTPVVAGMSAAEQAAKDAGRLTDDILALYAPNDTGDVLSGQGDFISAFADAVVEPSERERFIGRDGRVSQEGARRVRNALVAKAYGDTGFLERVSESTDDDMRNISNALTQAAPVISGMEAGIARGALDPSLSIREHVIGAVRELANAREHGINVGDVLNQTDLFGGQLSPETKFLLKFFDANKRSAKAIRTLLTDYAAAVVEKGDPRQAGLFGGESETGAQMLERMAARQGKGADGRPVSAGSQGKIDFYSEAPQRNAVTERALKAEAPAAKAGTAQSAPASQAQTAQTQAQAPAQATPAQSAAPAGGAVQAQAEQAQATAQTQTEQAPAARAGQAAAFDDYEREILERDHEIWLNKIKKKNARKKEGVTVRRNINGTEYEYQGNGKDIRYSRDMWGHDIGEEAYGLLKNGVIKVGHVRRNLGNGEETSTAYRITLDELREAESRHGNVKDAAEELLRAKIVEDDDRWAKISTGGNPKYEERVRAEQKEDRESEEGVRKFEEERRAIEKLYEAYLESEKAANPEPESANPAPEKSEGAKAGEKKGKKAGAEKTDGGKVFKYTAEVNGHSQTAEIKDGVVTVTSRGGAFPSGKGTGEITLVETVIRYETRVEKKDMTPGALFKLLKRCYLAAIEDAAVRFYENDPQSAAIFDNYWNKNKGKDAPGLKPYIAAQVYAVKGAYDKYAASVENESEGANAASETKAGEAAPAEAKTAKKSAPAEENAANVKEKSAPAKKPEQPMIESEHAAPQMKLANRVYQMLKKGEKIKDNRAFAEMAREAWGGTLASGDFDMSLAYDALEMGVNMYLRDTVDISAIYGDAAGLRALLERINGILSLLPTMNSRSERKQEYQQFSTPPNYAAVTAWLLGARKGDVVLEPSAGTGGLVIFAKGAGAEVVVNELDTARAALLQRMGFDRVFTENASYLNAVLPSDVRADRIVMNPPFSSSAGTGTRNDTMNAAEHVEQALKRLKKGGRAVLILGKGMADDAPRFAKFWNDIKSRYNVRANVELTGKDYAKYGTQYGNVIVVIDNTGPTPFTETNGGRKEYATITDGGKPVSLDEAITLLEGVAKDGTDNAGAYAGTDSRDNGGARADTENEGSAAGRGTGGAERAESGDRGESGVGGSQAENTAGGVVRESAADSGGVAVGNGDDSGVAGGSGQQLEESQARTDESDGHSGKRADGDAQREAEGTGAGAVPGRLSGVRGDAESGGVSESDRPAGSDGAGGAGDIQRGSEVHAGRAAAAGHADGHNEGLTEQGAAREEAEQENAAPAKQEAAPAAPAARTEAELTGSDAQISWARDIRRRFNNRLDEYLKKHAEAGDEKTRKFFEPGSGKTWKFFEAWRKFCNAKSKSKWWIDARGWLDDSTDGTRTAMLARLRGKGIDPDNLTDEELGKIADSAMRGEEIKVPSVTAKEKAAKAAKKAAKEEAARESEKKTPRKAAEPAQRDEGDAVGMKSEKDLAAEREEAAEAANADTGEMIFEHYISPVEGTEHPADLDESSAMAAVKAPEITVKLAPAVVEAGKEGKLSAPQMEAVARAAQSFETVNPDGNRRGFFIGDGTGVGKGREIAGIIYDQTEKGRGGKKALWLSKSHDLAEDAERDVKGIGAGDKLPVIRWKAMGNKRLDPNRQGILFAAYSFFEDGDIKKSEEKAAAAAKAAEEAEAANAEAEAATEAAENAEAVTEGGKKKGKKKGEKKKAEPRNRYEELKAWLGEDFDGVIVLDEAHMVNNVIQVSGPMGSTKTSSRALAVQKIVKMFPKARVVYVSATGATEVKNLAMLDRLGLWGEGTAFATAREFIVKIGNGGMAALELVARDMKAMGLYVARSLSFRAGPNGGNENVTYERLVHELTKEQEEQYNAVAHAWSMILPYINEAIKVTHCTNTRSGYSQFYAAMQACFNQILTSMSVDTLIADVEEKTAAGECAVIQLTSTNEAALKRASERLAGDEDATADDLDLTPKDTLITFLDNSFPVFKYTKTRNENGNETYELAKDSKGNPIIDPEAVALREKAKEAVMNVSFPDSPLDKIIRYFGTDRVAEVTGRSKRPDYDNKSGKLLADRRDGTNRLEMDAFQNGEKDILIFSDAGGTGFSFHADRTRKNQKKRNHYILQAGWSAAKAVQGLGRTNRSNQAHKPHVILVTTDVPGQKRFISTIARRLEQLGALTRGDKSAQSNGLFSEADNLESIQAQEAVKRLLDVMDGKTLERMGFKLRENGRGTAEQVPVSKFLNRVLALDVATQREVFGEFEKIHSAVIEAARANGTLDVGTRTFRADSLSVVSDDVVYKSGGIETRHVVLNAGHKQRPRAFDDITPDDGFAGYFFMARGRDGRGRVVQAYLRRKLNPRTGALEDAYVLRGPDPSYRNEVGGDALRSENYRKLTEKEAEKLWKEEGKEVPSELTEKKHLLSGAILPLWNSVNLAEGGGTVLKVTVNGGESVLGLVVPEKNVATVLKNIAALEENEAERSAYAEEAESTEEIASNILNRGERYSLAKNWALRRTKRNDEYFIEVDVSRSADRGGLGSLGLISEYHDNKLKFFVPNRPGALEKVLRAAPVREKTIRHRVAGEEQRDAAAAREEMLRGEPAARLTGDELREAGKGADALYKYCGEEFGGKVERPGAGDIYVTKEGLRGVARNGAESGAVSVVAALPDILSKGRTLRSGTDENGRASLTVGAPVVIGGRRYLAVAEVGEAAGKNGGLYLRDLILRDVSGGSAAKLLGKITNADGMPEITAEAVNAVAPGLKATNLPGGGVLLEGKGGVKIVVRNSDGPIEIDPAGFREEYGREVTPDDVATGRTVIMGREAFIDLVNGVSTVDDFNEEMYHTAEALVLRPSEIAVLERAYGGEHARAQAYLNFMRRRMRRLTVPSMRIFGRIKDCFDRIRAKLFGPRSEDIFRDIAEGRVWNREARESGTAARYRAESRGNGKAARQGEIFDKRGDVAAAAEALKAEASEAKIEAGMSMPAIVGKALENVLKAENGGRAIEGFAEPRGRSKRRRTFREMLDDAYTKHVDDLHPILTYFGEDLYRKASNALYGIGSKAYARILYGDKKNGVKGIRQIWKMIPAGEHSGFSYYAVLKHLADVARVTALAKEREAGLRRQLEEGGLSEQERARIESELAALKKRERFTMAPPEVYEKAIAEIEKAFPKWGEAQRELVKYNRALLKMLEDSGIISHELYYDLTERYPNYVPLQRDFGEAGGLDGFIRRGGLVNVDNPLKRLKGSEKDVIDPLEQIIKNTFEFESVAARQKVAREIVRRFDKGEYDGLIEQTEDASHGRDESVFYVYEDGKKRLFKTDNDMYYALVLSAGAEKYQANILTEMLRAPARALRFGTTHSLTFGVGNLFRDTFAYAVLGKDFRPILDTVAGFMALATDEELVEDFMRNGGLQEASWLSDEKRDSLIKELKGVKDGRFGNAALKYNPIALYFKLTGAFAEYSEQASRLGQYKRLLEKGYSKEDAIYETRDNMNFMRGGRASRAISRFVPFYNTSIQGVDKLCRTMYHGGKWDRKALTRGLLYLTSMSLLSCIMNYSDDDRRDKYLNLKQWRKNMFWNFVIGDEVISIPKPFEAGTLFASLPERFADYLWQKDRRAFDGFIASALSALTPEFAPLAFSALFELQSGFSRFYGRQIVPTAERGLRPELQYGPHTAEWAKQVASVTKYLPEFEGLPFFETMSRTLRSPRMLEYAVLAFTGSAGRDLSDLYNAGARAFKGDTRPAENPLVVLPGVRRLFADAKYGGRDQDAFRAELERLMREYRSARRLYEQGRYSEMSVRDVRLLQLTPQIQYADNMMNHRDKGINAGFRTIQRITSAKGMTAKEKREAIDSINALVLAMSRDGLARLDEINGYVKNGRTDGAGKAR